MINFSCSGCGREFSVADKFGGRQVRCKDCGKKLTIPECEEERPQLDDVFNAVLAMEEQSKGKMRKYRIAEESDPETVRVLPSAPQPRETRSRIATQRRPSKPNRKAEFPYAAIGSQLLRVFKVVFMLSVVAICVVLFMQYSDEIFPSQKAVTQATPTAANQPDPETQAAWAKTEAEYAQMTREEKQAAETLDPFVSRIKRFAAAREVGINYVDLKGAVVELSASYEEVDWTNARKDYHGTFIASDAQQMLYEYKNALHAWGNAIRYSGEELLVSSVERYESDRDKSLSRGDERLKKILEQFQGLQRSVQRREN